MDESQTIRVSVKEAATLLGIEKGSVKKRIQRGKLRSERDNRGTTWVYVDRSETVQDESQGRSGTDSGAELVDELRDRVRFLEKMLEEEREARTEEQRRHDTLMAQLMQRIPELEAPQERSPDAPRGEAGGASREEAPPASNEQQGRGPVPDAGGPQEAAERPWWRRVFGG